LKSRNAEHGALRYDCVLSPAGEFNMSTSSGMQVLAYDVRQEPLLAEVLNFRYVPLEELLQVSDIISLHCPYTPGTHHLINMKNIGYIKRGALLINTARGGLIDPAALTEALDEGIVAGAGLDVLEGEELLKDERQILAQPLAQDKLRTLLLNHSLLNRDNIVITPHIAFNSLEAVRRILTTTVDNAQAFLHGQPQNLVTRA
jgi:D-lactate dehydrogenase